ncbi:Sugar kinase of the NBD/HSP70 family, may contain an N-terminal HTH domain [Bifidobacterium bohemicum]|uniref:Putative NagC/XylR-type transcriptional regulator n=1 Tax=Bifidobacterium bohemicum DSM 22767 TaxID=1437606 RepID=A0A086ZEN1_9BIFI|nr:ROK family protein [Bifidobacterium bohemicum]KFI44981.1 putative NagC/XylR-type transcriptional regulator [Bifidobacterium bohemicum DSM 22767]SCC12576.1 Sugar kinase of the NBD/HSP70 family, may contain an N-terminal HTH domain [Bifidobacterium bohemicum]
MGKSTDTGRSDKGFSVKNSRVTAGRNGSAPDAALPLPRWFHGSYHTHLVAETIAKHGPIARTTLAQLLGLSQGALSRITSDLIYQNVIEEVNHPDMKPDKSAFTFTAQKNNAGRGRPQTLLRLKSDGTCFMGINLHGSELTAILTNVSCEPISSATTLRLTSTEPQDIAELIADLARTFENQSDKRAEPRTPSAISVSLGGHMKDDRCVTHAPYLHWDGEIDLAGMVEQRCGIPTAAFNDMDSLMLYESWFGDGVGLPRFAMLTIGAGIGYALCENGKPVDYPDKSYGLAGHILIDPEGPRCYAGHIGCSQCLTSDSLAQEYTELSGSPMTVEDLIADAKTDKPQARTLVNRVCFRLGTLIAITANFTMPTTVLINGETSCIAKLNTESVRNGISWYRPSQASPVDFRILDFSWQKWARAAAGRVIERYID